MDNCDIQIMLFIYNALQSGWSVEKIDYKKYKFKKNNNKISKSDNFENYFIKENLNI